MASRATALTTGPPTHTQSSPKSHLQTTESVRAQTLSVATLTADTLVADVLQNQAGESLTDPESVVLDATTTAPANVATKGTFWVKSDTPTRLFFTDDASTTVALTPGLGDMLDAGNVSTNQFISNVSSITFSGGVVLDNAAEKASGVDNDSVFIGAATRNPGGGNTDVSSPKSTIVGGGSFATVSYATIIGCTSSALAMTSASSTIGPVCVGYNNTVRGGGICIGTNASFSDTLDDKAILLGNVASGSPVGVIVGFGHTTSSLSASSEQGQVMVGYACSIEGANAIVLGSNSPSAVGEQSIAIGHVAAAGSTNQIALGRTVTADAEGACVIGSSSQSYAQNTLVVGPSSSCPASKYSSVILGYNCSGDNYSVVVGANSSSGTNARGVVVGGGLTARADNEFTCRGARLLFDTLTTPQDTPTTLLSLPSSSDDVMHVEVTVVAMRSDNLASYMKVFENIHFRNKAGTLTKAVGGSEFTDITDNSNGLVVTLEASAQNIVVTVQGNQQQTWNWRGSMRVYAGPLA